MAAGRVPAHKDLINITSVLTDVAIRPGKRSSNIFNVLRMRHSRREPITGNHDANAMPRQAGGQCPIESQETALIPMTPSAPMGEKNDGEVFLIFGQVNVELVLDRIGVGAVIISKIQLFTNFEDCL